MPEYSQLNPKSRRYHKMHSKARALGDLQGILDKLSDRLAPDARVTFTLKVSTLMPAETGQTSITWQLRPRV